MTETPMQEQLIGDMLYDIWFEFQYIWGYGLKIYMKAREPKIRKCPCWNSGRCEAYQRLSPIDPLCVYHYKEEENPNKIDLDNLMEE